MPRSSSHYSLVLNLIKSNAAKFRVVPNNSQRKSWVKSPLIVNIIHPMSVCIYSIPIYNMNSLKKNCFRWGNHYGPLSSSLFLSTSTHHPGIRIRNHFSTLEPACLNGRYLHFRSLVYVIDLLSKYSMNVWHQFIYSCSLDCTDVPWESLFLLLISLTFVNDIN